MNHQAVTPPRPSVTAHAQRQAFTKGWTAREVYLAMTDPDCTYPSGAKYPGQVRRIRGNLVAIVDEARNICVTVYENVKETALRSDQVAKGERIAS